jgi:aminoglycoside phosphotransferase (APT) family kinase protein
MQESAMIEPDNKILAAVLERWLADRLSVPAVSIKGMEGRSGAGFSAETFYIEVQYRKDGIMHERELAVRCQNQDSNLFLDASIALPYRVMDAVARHPGIPVPALVGLEMDATVLGEPFLVMEKMPGRVVKQSPNYNLEGWVKDLPVEQRGQVWRNSLDIMARIHKLDWRDGFTFLQPPGGGEPGLGSYLNWVKNWYHWMRGQGPVIPLMDMAMNHLLENMPVDAPVSVLWGDPNSSNILYDDSGNVSTVLDWEMATLGPAEVDLGWWLYFDHLFSAGFGVQRLDGLPDREQTIHYFESRLGRKVVSMDYFDLLAAFRMAIVGVRAVDRQILLGRVPATTTARSNQPTMCLLAQRLGQPEPELGKDFAEFSAAIGM